MLSLSLADFDRDTEAVMLRLSEIVDWVGESDTEKEGLKLSESVPEGLPLKLLLLGKLGVTDGLPEAMHDGVEVLELDFVHVSAKDFVCVAENVAEKVRVAEGLLVALVLSLAGTIPTIVREWELEQEGVKVSESEMLIVSEAVTLTELVAEGLKEVVRGKSDFVEERDRLSAKDFVRLELPEADAVSDADAALATIALLELVLEPV